MKYALVLVCLISSCSRQGNDTMGSLGEEVLKKKEGIDIRMTPIEEEHEKED